MPAALHRRAVTEKYSAQVGLSADGRSLVGYVAGEPFPMIDANDPHAGDKVMWDEVFRPISSDDSFKREFQVGSSTVNLQSGFATVCYHPSPSAPSPDSWFINMGAIDRNWFTPEAMARAAEGGHAISGD